LTIHEQITEIRRMAGVLAGLTSFVPDNARLSLSVGTDGDESEIDIHGCPPETLLRVLGSWRDYDESRDAYGNLKWVEVTDDNLTLTFYVA
jgi:hypothetical protein